MPTCNEARILCTSVQYCGRKKDVKHVWFWSVFFNEKSTIERHRSERAVTPNVLLGLQQPYNARLRTVAMGARVYLPD